MAKCKICCKEFVYYPSNRKGVYCSMNCMKIGYKESGNPRWHKGNNIRGKNNPNYRHGNRIKPYNISEWRQARIAVLKRDDGMCVQCDSKGNVVDHIIPWRIVKHNEIDNLQSLCRPCHGKKTAVEAKMYE